MIVLPAVGRGVVAYNSEMMNFGYVARKEVRCRADCPLYCGIYHNAVCCGFLVRNPQHTGHSCMRQVPPISAAVRATW